MSKKMYINFEPEMATWLEEKRSVEAGGFKVKVSLSTVVKGIIQSKMDSK